MMNGPEYRIYRIADAADGGRHDDDDFDHGCLYRLRYINEGVPMRVMGGGACGFVLLPKECNDCG